MVGIFKSIASFVKNTIFSTTTSTDHDSGRSCQSQGTRTSNNQDGNGNLKGENKALAHEQIPKEEGHNCDNHNRWDKDTSHTVSNLGNRCFGLLGIFNQFDDLR